MFAGPALVALLWLFFFVGMLFLGHHVTSLNKKIPRLAHSGRRGGYFRVYKTGLLRCSPQANRLGMSSSPLLLQLSEPVKDVPPPFRKPYLFFIRSSPVHHQQLAQ